MTIAEKLLRAKTDIDEVYSAGVEAGKAEGGTSGFSLHGTYILKEPITSEDFIGDPFEESFTADSVYAYFYDNRINDYVYLPVSSLYYDGGIYDFNTNDGITSYSKTLRGDWWYYYWYNESTDESGEGLYPDIKGRIIVFTKPTVVSENFYNLFMATTNGAEENYDEGAVNEKKRFWGIFQERTNWLYAFYQWRVDNIDPQYDVVPIHASNMFNGVIAYNGKNLNIPEIEARNNIKFDFSKCINFAGMMSWAAVEDLGFVDTTAATNLGSIFSNNAYLKRVSIAIKEDGSQNFSGAFDYTTVLEDFTIVSGVFGSNLNFQWAIKLSKASITSIINALSDSTSGLSITLSKISVDTAFKSEGLMIDGSTTEEWQNLIATKPNWTINLA